MKQKYQRSTQQCDKPDWVFTIGDLYIIILVSHTSNLITLVPYGVPIEAATFSNVATANLLVLLPNKIRGARQ